MDCVAKLRVQINFTMPASEEDWINANRTEIDIRRSHILVDALKEGGKRRFDATKLLKVICNGSFILLQFSLTPALQLHL